MKMKKMSELITKRLVSQVWSKNWNSFWNQKETNFIHQTGEIINGQKKKIIEKEVIS